MQAGRDALLEQRLDTQRARSPRRAGGTRVARLLFGRGRLGRGFGRRGALVPRG